jgi:site-specific DNA-methyltransferase (adenine-specific)
MPHNPADRRPITDLWSDIHRLKHNTNRVDHPCQLPPALMRRLFALYTRPGEVILDPFNGAGTSTLVAAQMSRGSIGIELSAEYHALARSRHDALARGLDPFAKRDTAPRAKNSRVDRLPKQKYAVSKKALQLDVRRIARDLGRLPTREEVKTLSPHPQEFFDRYFISWGEVCAAARTTGMTERPPLHDTPRPARSL